MKRLFPILVILILSFAVVPSTQGGVSTSLYLSPLTGTYTIGSTFSVIVKVSSGGETVNAAEATLNFNPHEISVINISKSGSIFTLWTTEPTFSNSAGTIKFGGGTSKNFTGTAGTIITISFRAKTVGTAKVDFSTGLVLAADFKGTNVLAIMNSGSYVISPEIVTPEYIPPENTPVAPIILSPTHSDPEKWYFDDNPKFIWDITKDIIGVKLLVDHNPITIPTIFYSEIISEKQLKDLDDGIWYFHIQLRNKFGWGGISHFKFQIDTIPPDLFEIKIKEGEETTNPQPTLFFGTTDDLSGIDYYEVKVDKEDPIKVKELEYKLLPQDLGKHILIINAVDKAGNCTLAVTEINILPIDNPIITNYPQALFPGSILSIKGKALVESIIKVYLQKNKKEEIKIGEVKSDAEGKWTYIEVEPVEQGVYAVWVEAIDPSGAKSKPSEKVTILVSPPVFIRIGKVAIDYLTTVVTLLVLILAILFGGIWGWRQIMKKRKKIKKEITEAEKVLYQAFKALKEETEEQVAKLDGKPDLSEREKKICNDLKKSLEISKKFIEKEIKDIEKELE